MDVIAFHIPAWVIPLYITAIAHFMFLSPPSLHSIEAPKRLRETVPEMKAGSDNEHSLCCLFLEWTAIVQWKLDFGQESKPEFRMNNIGWHRKLRRLSFLCVFIFMIRLQRKQKQICKMFQLLVHLSDKFLDVCQERSPLVFQPVKVALPAFPENLANFFPTDNTHQRPRTWFEEAR